MLGDALPLLRRDLHASKACTISASQANGVELFQPLCATPMAAIYNPFKALLSLDLEVKKQLSEAPKRKSHVRAASLAGDVQAVLSCLETIQDPIEATELALDAHKYLTHCCHVAAVQRLEQECDGLFRKKDDISSSADGGGGRTGITSSDAPAAPVPTGPDYDHNTAQIKTGKIGSMVLHIDRGIKQLQQSMNIPAAEHTCGPTADQLHQMALMAHQMAHMAHHYALSCPTLQVRGF